MELSPHKTKYTMIKLSTGWLTILALLFVSFSACDDDDDPIVIPAQTLTEIAANDDRFETLSMLLDQTGLDVTLEGAGPFTVFAPTDDAFANVDLSGLSDAEVRNVLLYHVLGGANIASSSIGEGQTYVTTANETGPGGEQISLLIERTGNDIDLNGDVNVTIADIEGTNGRIHVIDQVLSVPDIVAHASNNANLSQLVGALGTANLVTTLQGDGPFTVFAPDDDGFQAVAETVAGLTAEQLGRVLTTHVVSGNLDAAALLGAGTAITLNDGQQLTVAASTDPDVRAVITDPQNNEVNVIFTDIQGTNGIVHLLQAVLLPDNL